jgi:membrane protein YdbS with pleckstrin-like domain
MNLKLKAAVYTVLYMASAFGIGVVLSQLPNWVVGAFALVIGLVIVYSLIHAGLKFDAAVEKMQEKYKD